MKVLLSALFLLIFVFKSYTQEEQVYTKQELKQLAKEEKLAKREADNKQKKEATNFMLESHRFVLEADYVGDGKGQRTPVSSTINFIVIDSLNAVIQLGNTYSMGHNGVGGITVDGRITKYDLKVVEGKKSTSYTIMINIMTNIGAYDITLLISETGYADATIRGNTSGQLRYSGKLVTIDQSNVYKGTSI